MTKRATEVLGKSVVSAASGKKLGAVSDLLLDEHTHELLGVVVRHGMLGGESVLAAADVQSFGTDAVVSRSDALIDAREWRHRHPSAGLRQPQVEVDEDSGKR